MAFSQSRDTGTVFASESPGDYVWSNPGEANGSGDASCHFPQGAMEWKRSECLTAKGWGFTIPIGATIIGIAVEVWKWSNPSPTQYFVMDSSVRLLKTSGAAGDDKASTARWPAVASSRGYGSGTDVWGTSWTADEINTADFGFSISAKRYYSNITAYVRKIGGITVYYVLTDITIVVPAPATATASAIVPAVACVADAPPPAGGLRPLWQPYPLGSMFTTIRGGLGV